MDQGAASRSQRARAKGSSSTRVLDDWYVLCRSTELRRRPLARELYDIPIVVYRAGDRVGALLDRCPHRNAPLSLGRVSGETLQCGYHGWQFEETGRCRFIPGRDGEADHEGRRVPAFAAAEQDGFVWVYATPDVDPVRPPPRLAGVGEPGFTVAYQQFEVEGGLHAAAENTLPSPMIQDCVTALVTPSAVMRNESCAPLIIVSTAKGTTRI